MSGYLPDLANWALSGGGGNRNEPGANESGEQASTTSTPTANDANGPSLTDDEIRAKRLARMMGNTTTPTTTTPKSDGGDGNTDGGVPTPMDVENPNAAAATTKTTEAVVLDNGDKMDMDCETNKNEKDEPKKNKKLFDRKPAAAKKMKPENSVVKEPKRKRSTPSAAEAERKFQRRKEQLLRRVLSLSLSSSPPQDDLGAVGDGITGMSSYGLPVVTIDMGEESTIDVQTVAEILAARLSLSSDSLAMCRINNKALLPYLAQCHKRSSDEAKLVSEEYNNPKAKQKEQTQSCVEILLEINKQVVSYAASSLIEPDLFELGKDGANHLATCLLETLGDPMGNITVGTSGGASTSFYYCLCEELFNQDKATFKRVITDVLTIFIKKLSGCETVLDGGNLGGTTTSGLAIISALTSLCCHKKAAVIMTQHSSFLLPPKDSPHAAERVESAVSSGMMPPAGANVQQQRLFRLMQAMNRSGGGDHLKRSGPALEKDTLLGLVLRLGCQKDNQSVMQSFPNMTTASRASVDKTTDGMRRQLRVHQEMCNSFIRTIVTAGPEARDNFMKWIIDALLINEGASAMRPDTQKVSNPQTVLNISLILLKLCEPFVNNEKKALMIDTEFVSSEESHGGVFALEGDNVVTRLGDNPTTPANKYSPKNSFIPQCFFFCARALHLGIVPCSSYHTNLLRQISHTHWQLRQRNADVSSDPQFNHLLTLQHANEVSVLAPDMLGDTLRFFNLTAAVLLRITDDQLPLMPEHLVDDMCDVLIFVTRMSIKKAMERLDLGNIFKMVVKLLSPEYAHAVRNYNLRAKLGDVLYEVFLPSNSDSDKRKSSIVDSVACNPMAGGEPYLLCTKLAQETLAPSLLLLYGEVEHTGYYEKMTHRANIAALLKFLWESTEHRAAFKRITQNKESFIKFANGIMNEMNSLIASVMEKLPAIRTVQVQMTQTTVWGALSEEDRETITSRHEEYEHEVKRALPLCNKTLQMLGFLNTDQDIRDLFLLQEMCPRLVNMLLHVLTKLVGAKGLELKVRRGSPLSDCD